MLRVGAALAGLILLIVLTSGCIDKLNTEERLLCIDLTSKSYAYVPECKTQEECFSNVETSFFNFPQENLPSATSQELYYYKNHLALSWFYYNKALKNISAINSICSSDSGHEAISGQLNELNHNLLKAFEEAENSSKSSFSVILIEKISLQKDEVEKIKEEPLYDYYIKLNSNLNELSTVETEHSNSYVSFYFAQLEKFNLLCEKTGFKKVTIASYTPLDFIESYNKPLLGQIPNDVFYIPLVKEAVSSIFSFLNDAAKTKQAAAVLSTFPSFELLQSYNDFAGAENSVAYKFSELLSESSSIRNELYERNLGLSAQIEENFSEIEEKINALSSESYSFDSNFFSEIYFLLGQESSISTQKYQISEFSEASSLASSKILELKSNYAEMAKLSNSGGISLGGQTNSLKKILSETELLSENLDYLNDEVLGGLYILCDERISFIESKISETEIPEDMLSKVSDLKTRLKYKMNIFKKSPQDKEKLKLCKTIAFEYNDFRQALADFENYENNAKINLEGCFNYLDEIFKSYEIAISEDFDLGDLYLQYKKLKSIEQPYSNSGSVKASCLAIKDSLTISLSNNLKIKNLNGNYLLAKNLYLQIVSLAEHYPKLPNKSSLEKIQEDFFSLGIYFPPGNINFAEILPISNELNENILSFISDCKVTLREMIVSYLKENAIIETFSDSAATANEYFKSRTKITLNNPFIEIDSAFEFPLDLDLSFSEIIFKTENVSNIRAEDGKLFIDLKKIPLGITSFELVSKTFIGFSEKTELISATENAAIIQKEISLDNKSKIPKIKISAELMPPNFKLSNIFVSCNEKSLAFWMENNKLNFFLENAEPAQKAYVYFSALEPVQKEVKLISSSGDSQSTLYKYEIRVKNNLPFEIPKISLEMPFSLDFAHIKTIELITSEGKKADFKVLPGGNIIAFAASIKPFQEDIAYLRVLIEDKEGYWEAFLEELKNSLISLGNSSDSGISAKAGLLLQELVNLGGNPFDDEAIKSLQGISKAVSALKKETSKNELDSMEYSALKESVSAELNRFKEKISELRGSGFGEYANSLNSILYKAQSKMNAAENEVSAQDYKTAMDLLFEARSLLSESTPASISEKILSEKVAALQDYEKLSKIIEKFGLQNVFVQEKGKILSFDSNISALVSAEKLPDAKKELDLLEFSISDLNEGISLKLKSNADGIKSKIDSISLASLRSTKEKIDVLQSFFDDVSEEELISAQYIPPINKNRLEKLSLKLNSIVPADLRTKFDSFSEFYSKGNYAEALLLAQGFSDSLNEKQSEVNSIGSEINSASDSIKEEALVSFNSAAALFEKSVFNAEAQQKLELAESSLKSNRFLKSIVLSNSATALISATKNKIPEMPLAFYPIIAAAALILAVRFYKKNNKEKKKIRVQKVLRNW